MLKEGQEFKEIEDSYVIFIYDHDKFKKGLPFYHIQRRVDETGEVFGDGSHIIYVNGKYNGNDDIGQMMRDFHQCIPEQIKNEILSEAVAYYKGKEGRGVMSDAVREYGEEQKKAGIKEGQLELLVKFFRNNGTEAAAKPMLDASDEDIKIAKERLVSLS